MNFDFAVLKSFSFSESRALQLRIEAFNAFNHAQFFGPAAVNADVDSALFGQIIRAAPPRLMQAAPKFTFLEERVARNLPHLSSSDEI